MRIRARGDELLESVHPVIRHLACRARGTGKTVMLNECEDIALRLGWLIASETAAPGMVDRLMHTALPTLLQEATTTQTSRITSVSVAPVGGFSREVDDAHPIRHDLRTRIADLLNVLPGDQGLLLTVDEISDTSEVRDLGVVI